MVSLPLAPKIVKKDKNKVLFQIENLYPGYGVTIGNALRRVLLSSLQGAAVTEVKIKGVQHEFSTISGTREDVLMIVQNLKNLRFKIFEGEEQTATLKVKGEKEVTGKDFELPTQAKLANPECHIADLTSNKSELEMEIKIEKGIGYVQKEQQKKQKSALGTITLDAIFTPIRNVNFQVENMRVGDRTDFDRLNLEVETDGTTSPEEAFKKTCELIIQQFSVLLEGEKALAEKAEAENEMTKTKVEDLDLSAKTITALTENNIKTVGGLVRKTEKALLDLEGVGEVAVKEIKKALKKLNLELKEDEKEK